LAVSEGNRSTIALRKRRIAAARHLPVLSPSLPINDVFDEHHKDNGTFA
jgi:hypothetical protein